MKKAAFYKKIFQAYFVLFIVFAAAISVTIFYKGNQINQHTMKAKQHLVLDQISRNIDNSLLLGFETMAQLSTNLEMMKFMRLPTTDSYNIAKVREELAKTHAISARLGLSIALLKLADNTVVTHEGVLSIDRFFEQLGAPEIDTPFFYDSFARQGSALAYFTFNIDSPAQGKKLLLAKKHVSFKNADAVELYILDKPLLLSLDLYPSEAVTILNNEQIIAIDSVKATSTIESLLTEELRSKLLSAGNDTQTDRKYEYMYRKSSVLDWYYVSVTPKSFFIKSMQQLLLQAGILCVSLLLLGYLIISKMSTYLYRPVRNILGHLGQYEPFQEKDEFLYIQNTLTTVHETNRELSEIIQKNKLPQKERFLKQLLFGLVSEHEMKEQLRQNGLHILEETVRLVIIQIDAYDQLQEELHTNALVLIDAMISKHINAHLQDNFDYIFLQISKNQFVFVTKDEDRLKLTQLINELIAEIESHIAVSLIAVIGEPCEQPADLASSFSGTLNVLEKRFAIDEKKVIHAETIHSRHQEAYFYPIQLEHDLIHTMIRGQVSEADMIVQRIVQENLVKRTLSLETHSQLVFALSATINRVLDMTNKPIEYFFDEGTLIYSELKKSDNKKQFEDKIVYLFHTIATSFKKQSDTLEHSILQQMNAYIVNNYHTDFSLADLAEHLGFSTAYTSTLFKSILGENFKDYLNMYRIKRAKQLLAEEQLKISDVAARVGYTNVNSFIRMFKRYEAISPGQYAKNVVQEDQHHTPQ
ncbi:helix-turn-helix domain-containing protein [Paenibacillus sp. 598K]|uniref:helix-turn-helix domain-containing protein n=1 Tax=Paenibacillus sp. 598K TaxID=1117987 RepID=UPI00162333BE|nr:AraC family transcriptional regulator [Paenibacillus sp. 598K]